MQLEEQRLEPYKKDLTETLEALDQVHLAVLTAVVLVVYIVIIEQMVV
jgi:hypothetical protein